MWASFKNSPGVAPVILRGFFFLELRSPNPRIPILCVQEVFRKESKESKLDGNFYILHIYTLFFFFCFIAKEKRDCFLCFLFDYLNNDNKNLGVKAK